jgi:hypothetical protein
MNPFSSMPMPMPDPSYVKSLKRRKEVFERLCAAARDYLCLDLDEAIERAENPPRFHIGQQMAFTPEMLIDAIQKRDQVQGQLDSLEDFTEELPEKQADFLQKMQRPVLEQQLKEADNWISTIQKHLETDSVPSTGLDAPPAAVADTSTAANASRQNTEDACK